MEWVETTGRTVEEAKDAALDQLGVAEDDAEFEVVEEPKLGLFGRLRAEARVRARVRPTTPRPKEDRRERRRKRPPGDEGAATPLAAAGTAQSAATPDPADGEVPVRGRSRSGRSAGAAVGDTGGRAEEPVRAGRRGRTATVESGNEAALSRSPGQGRPRQPAMVLDRVTDEGAGMDVSLDEQAEVAKAFLDGLIAAMSLTAEIEIAHPDEDSVEVSLQGADLGTLIGPKGATLLALQDLTRTVVQRKTSASNGRLFVDVSSYRQKRRAALERFARQVAAEVVASGNRKVLEPMVAADRKVVHDTVTDIDGVETISEGEDPHRRVVILPAGG